MSLSYASLLGISDVSADIVSTNNFSATSVNVSGLTPSQVVVTDGSKNLASQSMANGSLIIGNAGSYSVSTITQGDNIVISNGPGTIGVSTVTDPTFGTITATNINTTNINTTSINHASLTPNRPLFSDANDNITSNDMGNGQLIIGNDGSYDIANISAGNNIVVNNGPGTISVATTETPTFTSVETQSMNVSDLTPNRPLFSDASDNITSNNMENGQLIIGNDGSYDIANITAGNNVVVNNGPGTISVATTETPTFTSVYTQSMNVSDLTVNTPVFTDSSKNLISLAMENGELIIGNSTTGVSVASLTASTNIDINSGPGSIAISTVSSPTFTTLTASSIIDTGLTANELVTTNSDKTLISTSLTAGSSDNITITNTTGNITLDVNTNPTFTSIKDTSLASAVDGVCTVLTDGTLSVAPITASCGNVAIGNSLNEDGSISASAVSFIPIISSSTARLELLPDYTGAIVNSWIDVNPDLTLDSLTLTTLVSTGAVVTANASGLLVPSVLQNGQLLIGNTSSNPSIATLTAGTGIAISNGNGSIEITATGEASSITGDIICSTIQITSLSGAQPNLLQVQANGQVEQLRSSSDGQLLIGAGGAMVLQTLTPGTNIAIENGSGTITVSTVTDPSFVNITATNTITAPNVTSTGTVTAYNITATNTVTVANMTASGNVTAETLIVSGLTPYQPVFANTSGYLESLSLLDGQIVIGNSDGDIGTIATLTAGSNMVVTNGHGSITLGVNSSPSFNGITLTDTSTPPLNWSSYGYTFVAPPSGSTDVLVGQNAVMPIYSKQILNSTVDNTIVGGTTPAAGYFTNPLHVGGHAFTYPAEDDTVITANATQTLLNKTISGAILNSNGDTVTAITGATIDNSILGGITPCDGTFDDLISGTLRIGPATLTPGPVVAGGTLTVNGGLNLSSLFPITIDTTATFTFPTDVSSDVIVTETSTQTLTNKTLTAPVVNSPTITQASITLASAAVNSVVVTDANQALVTNSTYTGYLSGFTSDPQTQINNINTARNVFSTDVYISTSQTDTRDDVLSVESQVPSGVTTGTYMTDIRITKGGYGGVVSGFSDLSLGFVGCSLWAGVDNYGDYEVMRAMGNGSGSTGVIIGNDAFENVPPNKGLLVSGGIRCSQLVNSSLNVVSGDSNGNLYTNSVTGVTGITVVQPAGDTTDILVASTPNIVQSLFSDTSYSTTTTPTLTSHTCTITPTSSYSKIMVNVYGTVTTSIGSSATQALISIDRNGVNLGAGSSNGALMTALAGPNGGTPVVAIQAPCTMGFLDSPATLSPVTYTVTIFRADGNGEIEWGSGNLCVMILQEIGTNHF
jgi:hypothetical protein